MNLFDSPFGVVGCVGDYLPEAYALAANYLSALWAGLMEFADLITAKMAVLRCRRDAGGTKRARRPRSQD